MEAKERLVYRDFIIISEPQENNGSFTAMGLVYENLEREPVSATNTDTPINPREVLHVGSFGPYETREKAHEVFFDFAKQHIDNKLDNK